MPVSSSVHVYQNQASGSHYYVFCKEAGIVSDDAMRNIYNASTHMQASHLAGLKLIDNNISFWKSMVAATGIQLPTTPSAVNLFAPFHSTIDFFQRVFTGFSEDLTQQDWLHSEAQAYRMIELGRMMPGDIGVNRELNHKLVTHNKDGSLNIVQREQILPYFTSGNADHWPTLFLTSSHALVRDHKDVSDVMEGFHRLIAHCFNDDGDSSHEKPDRELPLIRRLGEPVHKGAKKTIMVAAVYNDHNAWVNGGTLLLRLLQLDRLFDDQHKEISNDIAATYMKDMSPHAVRLSKLMLSLIVEDPTQINMDSMQLTHSTAPLMLRNDAAHVLQHIKLGGYSKGGNVVSDAVRGLIFELQQPGQFIMAKHNDLAPVSPRDISHLISNIGILCVNPGITPLTQRARDLGMRRLTIRNRQDRITAHLFRKHEREGHFGEHDDVYVINGQSLGDLGHGISAALGQQDKPGYLIDEELVAPEDIPTLREVRSRLKSFFASFVEKVGISNVVYSATHPNELEIEFSTGVSEEKIGLNAQHIATIMEEAGLKHVSMRCDLEGSHRCAMQFNGLNGADPRSILAKGFRMLAREYPDIFVAQSVFRELGMGQPLPLVEHVQSNHAALQNAGTAKQ